MFLLYSFMRGRIMGLMSEIYLTKKFVSKEEWLELINTISNYNGILKKWKIIMTLLLN